MAKVMVTLEDQESGEFDGGVKARFEFEPALAGDARWDAFSPAQIQGLALSGYLKATYGTLDEGAEWIQ